MGLLDWMAHGMQASTPGPAEDFWYHPAAGGPMTLAGVKVDAEQAKTVSAWYRGRDLLATSLAMLPLQLFERLPAGGATIARGNPLYDVLHRKPNEIQDSFVWRRQMMYHLIDHGNGYNRIVEGPRGFVDQLIPINPSLVTPELASTGRRVYRVRDPQTGRTTIETQDAIFHLMGASDDGIAGKGVLEHSRNSLGTALATEHYAATVFSRGTLNSGAIETPGKLDAEASKRMARSFLTNAHEWHLPKVLEQGAKWVQSDMTPEDAQMLLSRKFSIDDIARWLGIPRMMLENSDPSFGNAEQFNQNFVTFSLGAWLSLWEFAINDQLVLAVNKYFSEFTRDALVRGDLATRWTAHVASVNAGIKTVDEARAVENLNPRGGKADELRQPQNITGKPAAADDTEDEAPPPVPPRRQPVPVPDDEDTDRARAIVVESASRLIRKEVKAMERLAVRYAAQPDAFAVAVTEFYAEHVALLEASLLMPTDRAQEYCASQALQVLGEPGVRAIVVWSEPSYAAGLAAWALEMERAA